MNRSLVLLLLMLSGLSACNEPDPGPAARIEYANYEVIERSVDGNIRSIKFRSTPVITDGFVEDLSEVYSVVIDSADSLPASLGKLPKLAYLVINTSPNVTELPASYGNLPSLVFLSIGESSITKFPETFRNASKLKTVYVGRCPASLFESLTLFPSLEKLSLQGTIDLPDALPLLPGVVQLGMYVTSKFPKIGGLTNVETVEISGSNASNMPGDIGTLTKLKTIRLSFHRAPLTIGNELVPCVALENIYLSNNVGITLPSRLGELKSLRVLSLFESGLEAVPGSIGGLSSLEELTISKSKVKTLPSSIGQLSKLKRLSVIESALETVPAEIGQLTDLEFLALNGNAILSLPSSIGNLKKVSSLVADKNKITEIPSTIGDMSFLRTLELNGNQLTALPTAEIKRLTRLLYLSVGNNQIPKAQVDELKVAMPALQIWE
ncbi:MAG TPA: leucine-rich repeat domain-containing protein [Cyclobacteriaceae bacterium]|nr:leucine-rich repeat domain-containing protein [Cyclobacteriaceae bacterium]